MARRTLTFATHEPHTREAECPIPEAAARLICREAIFGSSAMMALEQSTLITSAASRATRGRWRPRAAGCRDQERQPGKVPSSSAADRERERQRKQPGPEQIRDADDARIGALKLTLLRSADETAHPGEQPGSANPDSARSGMLARPGARLRQRDNHEARDAGRPDDNAKPSPNRAVTGPTQFPAP